MMENWTYLQEEHQQDFNKRGRLKIAMRDNLSATVELMSQDTGYLAAMEGWVVMGVEIENW